MREKHWAVYVATISDMLNRIDGRNLSFLFLLILSFLLFRRPLAILLSASPHDDRYSHVFFIPLISASLVYFQRRMVFQESRYCFQAVPLLLIGIAFFWTIQRPGLFADRNDYLSCSMFAMVLTWVAAFFLCYGWKPLRTALFPLGFLVLMIPMPTILLDRTVDALQRASADVTDALFRIFGVPAFWHGPIFSVGGYQFEIAKECSGIHSCMVLFVTSILVGHLFVRSTWARVCFSLFTILVAIFKNAVRIVTISGLTAYVDQAYYNSWLHRNGGVAFSLVALAILVPLLLALQKAETYARRTRRPRLEPPLPFRSL
jgi:exosortase